MLGLAATAPGPDSETLDGLAEATRLLAGGGSLAVALDRIAEAAARGAGADLVVVRAGGAGDGLAVRALWTRSGVLAAELEGTRLAPGDLGADAREFGLGPRGDAAPVAVRRAAALAHADRALVVPVGDAGAVELYRAGPSFDDAETALARLAAAQVELALALDGSLGSADGGADRAGLSLELAGEALASGSDERELAEHVVRLVAGATGATRVALWRIEADARPVFLAAHGDAGEPPADAAAIAEALERGEGGARAGTIEGRSAIVALGAPAAGALELVFAAPGRRRRGRDDLRLRRAGRRRAQADAAGAARRRGARAVADGGRGREPGDRAALARAHARHGGGADRRADGRGAGRDLPA